MQRVPADRPVHPPPRPWIVGEKRHVARADDEPERVQPDRARERERAQPHRVAERRVVELGAIENVFFLRKRY